MNNGIDNGVSHGVLMDSGRWSETSSPCNSAVAATLTDNWVLRSTHHVCAQYSEMPTAIKPPGRCLWHRAHPSMGDGVGHGDDGQRQVECIAQSSCHSPHTPTRDASTGVKTRPCVLSPQRLKRAAGVVPASFVFTARRWCQPSRLRRQIG